MKKIVLAAAAALTFTFAASSVQAAEDVHVPKETWSFDGMLGKFDRQQLQRGFQVYREVCAACHSLHFIAFRNLQALGYSEDQIKVLAAEYTVQDGPDDTGSMFERPGRPTDRLPKPFPNDNAARASNGGALPPDLSLITKARVGGPNYIYYLMMGYTDPPAGVELPVGMSYNLYFPGHQIAMTKQLNDGQVTYADGTANTADQLSRDVAAFLHWASEPKLEVRKATGVRVILFTLFFTILAFFFKKRIWARLEKH